MEQKTANRGFEMLIIALPGVSVTWVLYEYASGILQPPTGARPLLWGAS